jgi:glycolate oxidase FAD binding subunit
MSRASAAVTHSTGIAVFSSACLGLRIQRIRFSGVSGRERLRYGHIDGQESEARPRKRTLIIRSTFGIDNERVCRTARSRAGKRAELNLVRTRFALRRRGAYSIWLTVMKALQPSSPQELASALAAARARRASVELSGRGSKRRMGGAVQPADTAISAAGLQRVLVYEPKDLTVSVEAGMPWCELARVLARERQMVPLDPPFFASATVGGVVVSNTSGPRRRLYGTARDFIIGMKFATSEGKLVQTGGMVVKNVAGLDMAKLMIGSMGTLAAVAVVNFKVVPMPPASRTLAISFSSAGAALEARDGILRGILQPAAIDLLNPKAAAESGRKGFLLAVQAGGNPVVLDRYQRELQMAGETEAIEGPAEEEFWRGVREFVPAFLARAPRGAVVRVSATLAQLTEIFETLPEAGFARAGSGIVYGCFTEVSAAVRWMGAAGAKGWKAIIEYAPEDRAGLELWPNPGNDLRLFEQIKDRFDPDRLLNRGRLYHRI